MITLTKAGRTVQCLIIDDDRIDAEVLKRLLRKSEINNPITHASDAQQALNTLQSWVHDSKCYPPVLVFLDLRMPRMSGTELIARLESEPFAEHLKILVVSTSQHPVDQAELAKHQIMGCINKKDLGTSFKALLDNLANEFELKTA